MTECGVCKGVFSDEIVICVSDGSPTSKTLSGPPVLGGVYKLEKRINQGGMGIVYEAFHIHLKTKHAVKVILPGLIGDPEILVRFQQEAIAGAAVKHSNVVSVTDFGLTNDKLPFLVMDFVSGNPLYDYLKVKGRLSPHETLELFTPIVAGVSAIHEKGIVHRDLKSLNLIIADGFASFAEALKILDFGLAKIKSPDLLQSFIQAKTNGILGSIWYMSPQQLLGEDTDPQDDVYSLGVLLFEMLTGRVPFDGKTQAAIINKVMTEAPPTFAELGVQIAPQIEEAVRDALEKERRDRTPTVEGLLEELRKAVEKSEAKFKTPEYSEIAPGEMVSLSILTNPAGANVFINNVEVGCTRSDGWLLLGGHWKGFYTVKVSLAGFNDCEETIYCIGEPRQMAFKLPPRLESAADAKAFERWAESDYRFISNDYKPDSSEISAPVQSIYFEDENALEEFSKVLPPQSVNNSVSAEKPQSPILLLGLLGLGILILAALPTFFWLFLERQRVDLPEMKIEEPAVPTFPKEITPIEQIHIPATESNENSTILSKIAEKTEPVIKSFPIKKRRPKKFVRRSPVSMPKNPDCIYTNSCE